MRVRSSGRTPTRPGPGPLRRASWSPVALTVLFCVIVGAQVAVTGDPELQTPVFGVSFLVLHVLSIIFAARAALSRSLEAAQRRPWRFMVPALVAHLLSTLGFAVADIAGLPASEWVGIASRLAMVPLLLAAVLAFPMRRLGRSERYKLWLDVTTVAGGGFIAMWYFIIGPALTSGGSASLAVSLAGFPIGDLVLIFGVCAVLLRGGATGWRRPPTILLIGLVVFLAGDVYFSYTEVQNRGADLTLGTTLSLLVGTFLVVVAAVQQVREAGAAAAKPARPGAGGVSHLPYAGLGIGYLLLLVATAREGSFFPWGGLVAGVIVMTGAVAVRQLIAMRENHTLVVTDNLTGLANRMRVRSQLEQAVDRQKPVAVLLIDLDGFKQVNDTFGHEAGDALLIAFAGVLRDNTRPTDTAGRLGGDEFAVVLDGVSDVDTAGAVAARILAVAATPGSTDARMPIRCSVGVALARRDDNVQSLLHRADVAMYAAKRAGRHGWLPYAADMEEAPGDPAPGPDDAAAVTDGQLALFA